MFLNNNKNPLNNLEPEPVSETTEPRRDFVSRINPTPFITEQNNNNEDDDINAVDNINSVENDEENDDARLSLFQSFQAIRSR